MKKLLLCVLIAFVTISNAQKNTFLLQGNINYNTQKEYSGSDSSRNYFGFSPKIGYQFNSNWTLGTESSFFNSKESYSNGEFTNKQFSIGPFIRYSKPLSDLFTFYCDLGIGYQEYKTLQINQTTIINDIYSNGYYSSFTPAVLMNIGKGFGLNFNLGGIRYSQNNNNTSPNGKSNFNFNFGNYFAVGISKNFK